MSNIDILVNAGPDAFNNLFDVKITFPSEILSPEDIQMVNNFSVRTQGFTPPSATMVEYDIRYKAIKLKRFAPKINMDRKLSLNLRLDAAWKCYDLLKAWKKLYFDESLSQLYFYRMLNSLTDTRYHGKIELFAYKTTDSLQDVVDVNNLNPNISGPKWTFENVVCQNVSEPAFVRDSANALELKVDFLFGRYIPPENQPNT